jgi:glycosyltransferase involved in cell wall biosynthesis
MPAPASPVRALLALVHTLDPQDWARRHAAGEVPDAWPYGLDRLAAAGVHLDPRPGLTGAHATVARGLRQLGGYSWWEAARTRVPAGVDVVLSWEERVGVPLALRSRQVPVATGVIWITEQHSRVDPVARAALRRAGAVWALSSAQLPVLAEWGVHPSRLHHLAFGVDAEFFAPAGPASGELVVSAGNDRHRDHATLVEAMGRLQARRPGLRLSLATRAAVDMPAALGRRTPSLTHRELRAAYAEAAVVAVALHPNLHVSGVTVVLEAMASERPVVVTRTPGMSDYVVHGETGLLVPPGDPEALADAVGGLLADPARARAMGQAGRRAVVEGFSTATQARALAGIVGAALQ